MIEQLSYSSGALSSAQSILSYTSMNRHHICHCHHNFSGSVDQTIPPSAATFTTVSTKVIEVTDTFPLTQSPGLLQSFGHGTAWSQLAPAQPSRHWHWPNRQWPFPLQLQVDRQSAQYNLHQSTLVDKCKRYLRIGRWDHNQRGMASM